MAAYPASLGAKCAAPDKPVVCFTGDGGFWYHLSELETAVRCNINTVTIVNNNNGFGQCLTGVEKAYGNRIGNKSDLYKFNKINFARIAEKLGCIGIRVEHPDEIETALGKALPGAVTHTNFSVRFPSIKPPMVMFISRLETIASGKA